MLADAVIVLAILLKIVLRLVEMPGTTAIAATVTSAAAPTAMAPAIAFVVIN